MVALLLPASAHISGSYKVDDFTYLRTLTINRLQWPRRSADGISMAETVTDGPAERRRRTLDRVGIAVASLWLPVVFLLCVPQLVVATGRYHADWCGETDETYKGFSCTDLGYSTVGALAALAVIAAAISVYLAIRSRGSVRPWLALGISAILIASSWLILYEARYAV